MSLSESPGAARRSVVDTLTQLQAKLNVTQDSLTKRNREIDQLNSQHTKEATHLRTLFAHYLLRLHVRSHKTKRILMQLHLTALEMEESLAREEQRAAAGSGDLQVYDEKHEVSKATLRKLAHLYRKRPLHITAELDDKFTHEIKSKFFYFLNNYQSIVRENETMFVRNVALTKETLDYKQTAEDDRRERDKAVKDATDKTERLEGLTREVEELRRKVSKMERDEEVRKKKEAARAVQARTEQYSKSFRGLGVSVDEEMKEAGGGVSGSDSPLSPTPRSPSAAQSSSGLFLALSSSSTSASSKRLTAGSGGLPSLDMLPTPPSPKIAAHPLATPTHTNKSSKRNTANARQLASINTKRSDSPLAADKFTASPLTPATPSSAKSPKMTVRDDSKQISSGSSGGSLPAIVSPRGGKR